MAQTRNLKLKLSSDLTADAKYNLERIDLLGSVYQVDATQSAKVRSATNILLLPNNPDVGGTGVGGDIILGSTDQPLSNFTVNADTVTFSGSGLSLKDIATGGTKSLELKYKSDLINPVDLVSDRSLIISTEQSDRELVLGGNFSLLGNNLTFNLSQAVSWTLPSTAPAAGDVLTNDGSDVLTWAPAAGSYVSDYFTWDISDGSVKTITHNYGTNNIQVQVFDENNENIDIYKIKRLSNNVIELTASQTPSAPWTIMLVKVG